MKKITVDQCLDQTPCGERLLAYIVREFELMIDYCQDKEDLKRLKDQYKLGTKLLTYDYYKEADALEKQLSKTEDGRMLLANVISEDERLKPLMIAREEAAKAKKQDYIKFFSVMMFYLEDWC